MASGFGPSSLCPFCAKRDKLAVMSHIRFAMIQHPVGQGDFHTGWLYNGNNPIGIRPFRGPVSFAWTYDCGSEQSKPLEREIGDLSGAPFNVLFLSHLDDDHVSGIDDFLNAALSVDEVVLPYLSDTDWALHLAAAASSGALSAVFIDLASDPAGWFGERGVKRMTYVETDSDDDDHQPRPDPVEPFDLDPDRRGKLAEKRREPAEEFTITWTRPPRLDGPSNGQGNQATVELVPLGAVATLTSSVCTLDWILAPYAFRPSSAQLSTFQSILDSKFGPGLAARDYANAAPTEGGREHLRECYDKVWKTHNLHSMALYAGPATGSLDKVLVTAWHGHFLRRIVQPGWISTGDFDTSVKKRRERMLAYYLRYAGFVGQLSLPHHGSDHSFDEAILAAFPDLSFAVAAVGRNGHGHPGADTQDAVAAAGLGFVRVDECVSSSLEVGGRIAS